MSKEIYISSTPHETRLAIVENDALTEIYYERENEYTLAGSIYNGKVTRVLPGMQSSFVDIGLERDAFLYITDFMEEAGDSADFDAADSSRAPRSASPDRNGSSDRNAGSERGDRNSRDRNDRGDRNGRADRGDRNDQPRLPERTAEPSDAELFTQAVSGLDPARPVAESERSDRGGNRRGGRNRRDRNFNSDGSPRRDRPEAPRSESRPDAPRQEARPEAPRAEPIRTDAPPTSFSGEPSDQIGEAAPGADGSRRWRGRRGRRGNRGREDSAQHPALEAAPETAAPIYDEPAYEIGASAPAEPLDRTPDRTPRGDRPERSTDRPDSRGAERGDRGNRGDRNRPDRASQQPPRIPRGFTPSLGLYKVDGAADETLPETPYGQEPEFSAPIEPIILPGESLSKYRAGSSEPAPASTPQPTQVAADFTLPGAWDGGFVLPGETLRRREPSSSAPAEDRSSPDVPRREDRGGRDRNDRDRNDRDRNDRGRNDRGGRDNRSGYPDRGSQPERESPLVPANLIPDYQPEPEPFLAETDQVAEPISASHAVAPIHSTFVAPPPVPDEIQPELEAPHEAPSTFSADHVQAHPVPSEDHSQAQPEAFASQPEPEPAPAPASLLAPEHEFEPTEASASFRLDPIPPREFRQPSPVLEATPQAPSFADPEAAVDLAPAEPISHIESLPAGIEAIHAHPSEAHTASPNLHEPIESRDFEAPAAAEHELTSINNFGEMHSEPASDSTPGSHLPQIDSPEPGSPIEHESAIVDASSHDRAQPETSFSVTPETLYFAPGDGHLEEEEFVEDDEVLPSVHASSILDQEGFHNQLADQETLEGVADLGTMLREMSIDHITRTEPSSIDPDEDEDYEEDDLEEDFLEEDQLEDDETLAPDAGYPEDGDEAGHATSPESLDEIEDSAYASGFEGAHAAPTTELGAQPEAREPRREGRRDERGRRDGRRGDRNRRDRGNDRDRNTAFTSPSADSDHPRDSDRPRSDSRGGRGARQSMQSTNLPAISDLLKPGQELLCQIAKEPIAKKGARITSHIALPGRFLVFMPTVHHTGVSRKIESDSERRRLKEILLSERGEATGGFIVRTAAAGATEEELRSDLRFLLNLWADIKTRSESSKSPALIYHDLNLVERVLRDQVTDTFSAIWVDTETEYERVLRFLQRFQPSLIRRVKLYTKETPLFEQFGITEEINKALRSKVWLKSGGSIVINQTEALVAIDINTGKFVGKTARLEDTIVKTNLDAIPEIVRQIRLRDLGGIIIIDFIDMDERKNRNKVMAALEEELKSDRAPSKVLQFNDFGLVAITRKRVKQSLERTLSTTCGVCQGTGMVKSPVSVCNDIYIEMRKMHKHLDRGDVMLRVHPEVVKQLKSTTKWLQEMEEMVGKTILVKSDPSLHPEQFDIH
jgi:ribonuclease E